MAASKSTDRVTAAVLVIGDEILSGRTQDTNIRTIATFLAPLGVQLAEARVVSDDQDQIVMALNALRSRCDYVFTTGGIGPTHDDITADAVAAAFGVSIDVRDDARALLQAWYDKQGTEFTPARMRMARIPDGAELIANPVSVAPGFQIGNVFVMAGIPSVVRGMLEDVPHRIKGGMVVEARTVSATGAREADLAPALSELAAAMPDLSFGSYPWMRPGTPDAPRFGVNLVVRGADPDALDAAEQKLADLIRNAGGDVAGPDDTPGSNA